MLCVLSLSPTAPSQLGIALAADRGWGPAGQEPAMACRDSCSSAMRPDNFVSTSVSHSRTDSGCQNNTGIRLASVKPKTLKQMNNLPSIFLKLSCGSSQRIKEYSKYLEQWDPNTLTSDQCLNIFKDFHIHS